MGQLGHSRAASAQLSTPPPSGSTAPANSLRKTLRCTTCSGFWAAPAETRSRPSSISAKPSSLDPKNLRASYALALEVERQGAAGSEEEFQKLIQQILAAQPNNLAGPARIEPHLRQARRRRHAPRTIQRIAAQSAAWPADVKQQLAELEAAASGPEPRAAATRSIFLRNVLMQVPAFRASLSDIKPQPGDEAQPFTHFLRLPFAIVHPCSSRYRPYLHAAAAARPRTTRHWTWIGAVSLTGEGAPSVVVANAHQVKLTTGANFPFPGGASATDPTPEGILPIDFNYDFKTDLVLAGAGGVRLMRQDNPTTFTDVTAQTKLPNAVLDAAYTGAWAVDIEADGDLDIVLGQASGLPTVLRNNGDGSFTAIHPFAGISGIRQFVWADFNGDGNPDAALIDGAGHLHVFFNQRSGNFSERAVPAEFASVKAITAADVNSDGLLDLVAVLPNGAIARLSSANNGQTWTSRADRQRTQSRS